MNPPNYLFIGAYILLIHKRANKGHQLLHIVMLIHMPPSFTSVYALKDLDVFTDGLLLTEIEDTQTTLN